MESVPGRFQVVDEIPEATWTSDPIFTRKELEKAGVDVKNQTAWGLRCGRCWRYGDAVGKVPGWPDLCMRCADVVEAMGLTFK
jgi:hypothetical protein